MEPAEAAAPPAEAGVAPPSPEADEGAVAGRRRRGGPKAAAAKGRKPARKRKSAKALLDLDEDGARTSRAERDRRLRLKKRRKRLKRMREARVRPSPPLQETDPLAAYLAGEMVPCPVGCGGFSEVVRIGTLENGAGDVWFECLSCAQRRNFEVPAATAEERRSVLQHAEAEGHEPYCPRHGERQVALRRRGKDFVCPACGVVFPG